MTKNFNTNPPTAFKLLVKTLEERGFSVTYKKDRNHKTTTILKSPNGAVWEKKPGNFIYPFHSKHVVRYSDNKNLASKFASQEGLPIPSTLLLKSTTSDKILKNFLKNHKVLAVKPNDSYASSGLTLNITSLSQLEEAIRKARLVSRTVLVQEQVDGEEIRITFLNGEVICTLLRRTARVVGDGTSSVKELIRKENKLRRNLVFKYINYSQLDAKIIQDSFLKSSIIPVKGEVVELNRSTMISGGCSVYNISEKVNPGYIKIAEKLVQKLGAHFLVVDIVCKDFTKPPSHFNYHFLEFNRTPALKLFYSCSDKKMVNIIPKLAALIDENLKSKNPDEVE